MPNSGPDGTWLKGPEDWSAFLPILSWKIIYTDGTTFTSDDGSWADAPGENVAMVTVYHEGNYRTSITGRDEYCMKDETATKLGGMVGAEVDCAEWEAFYADWFGK